MAPASPWASTVTVRPDSASKSASSFSSTTNESWVTRVTSPPAAPDGVTESVPEVAVVCSAWVVAAAPLPDEPQPAPASTAAPASASARPALWDLSFLTMIGASPARAESGTGGDVERTFLRRHDPDQVRRSRTSCPALSPAHRTPVSRWSLAGLHRCRRWSDPMGYDAAVRPESG